MRQSRAFSGIRSSRNPPLQLRLCHRCFHRPFFTTVTTVAAEGYPPSISITDVWLISIRATLRRKKQSTDSNPYLVTLDIHRDSISGGPAGDADKGQGPGALIFNFAASELDRKLNPLSFGRRRAAFRNDSSLVPETMIHAQIRPLRTSPTCISRLNP